MMDESICYECVNYMKITTDSSCNRMCTFGFRDLDHVRDCTHFKQKKVEDKEFGEGKIEKAVDKKGQIVEECQYTGCHEEATRGQVVGKDGFVYCDEHFNKFKDMVKPKAIENASKAFGG